MSSIARSVSVWLLFALLAVSVAASIGALSLVQLTSTGRGERILRRAVAASTDLDAAIPGIQERLREQADDGRDDTVQVPDFPIPVTLTRDEARTLTAPELRDRILNDSGATLYEEGMSAWTDNDPEAGRDFSRVSAAGALNDSLGLVRDGTHTAALVLTLALALITMALGLASFLAVPWRARLLVLGGAGLLAGLPLLAAAVALRFAFRTAGPDDDRFVNALFDIGADSMWVPVRNYFTLTMVSLGVMVAGTLLHWWEARYLTMQSRKGSSA